MKKFFIHTMGCKSNQFESSVITENLINNGYEQVKLIEDADLYILNSCSVTHKSDNEAMYLLRNSKHKNKNIFNIITGCVAQIEKEKLLNSGVVDLVVGNNEKLNLSEVLKRDVKCFVTDILEQNEFTYAPLSDTSKTRISLKIQDGCNNRCSYCIIPFARGNSRSAKSDFIINQIQNFVEKGFKEVVFTGIHIGLWGQEWGLTLLDLLKEVEEKTSISRYRLGSLYPNEITDEMLEFLSNSEKFCPHFHLSLQSACDKTLQSMNRHYKTDDYIKLIDKINKKFNLPFIGSDIITGFAGETEEDFNVTVNNLKKSGLSQIHTFPYSVREGTVGATAPNQIPDKVKEERANIVKEISKNKLSEFLTKNIGTQHTVLIEKHPDKKTGLLKGVTGNYITVLLNSSDIGKINTLVKARIKKANNGTVFADIEE